MDVTMITYNMVQMDYPIMRLLGKTVVLPKPLIQGKSATNQALMRLASGYFINKTV